MALLQRKGDVVGNLQVSGPADRGEVGREEKEGVLGHECFTQVADGARNGALMYSLSPSMASWGILFPLRILRRPRVGIER